jgi:hypothetical protein
MIKTPRVPKESPEVKSKELCSRKHIQDAVRDVQQIISLSENQVELRANYEYWTRVLKYMDPDGTFSHRRL